MNIALLRNTLQEALQTAIATFEVAPVGGGCINNTYRVTINQQNYFLKYNTADYAKDMFQKEANALNFLSAQHIFRIPQVICSGTVEDNSFLLLEYINSTAPNKKFWQKAGAQLAQLHAVTQTTFGLDCDNYIGSLPQSNKQHKSFCNFFIYERLEPLLRLGEKKKLFSCSDTDYFENLYMKLPALLPDEKPALLHGDLWSGNIFSDTNHNPVIFDPAMYFGNREAELAFTTLFGGFDNAFYDAYFQENPLPPGYEKRIAIYNLYPLLVHLHLFGISYYAPIIKTLKQFA